jgi:sulfate-transporting ATPase
LYIGEDKIIQLSIAVVLTFVLWATYKFTRIGLGIRAGSENEQAATTLGWSVNALAGGTWLVGGALAAMAGVLLSNQLPLTVNGLTLLVIPTLAAALAGSFASFPLTLLGALAIGMGQSIVANYLATSIPGIETALPFGLIIFFLVIRGHSLPIRGALSTARLPELGTGIVRWRVLIPVVAVVAALGCAVFPLKLVEALTTSLAWAIILLSVVVLMGFAGQVDLAPLAWGGIAALLVAYLIKDADMPFGIAVVLGTLATIPIGLVFGMPALRARGLNLAVVTLGLGVMVHAMIFANDSAILANPYDAGGGAGTYVGRQKLFGQSIDFFGHPRRYFALVLAVFVGLALVVASVRRGRMGRRLIAVRTNERAAAALGISVFGSKLYAFALSAGLAALGGIFLGFESQVIVFKDTYDPITSMLAAAYAVIGGVGYILGAVLGSVMPPDGVGAWQMDELFPGTSYQWLSVIGGVSVLIILLQDPNGLVSLNVRSWSLHRRQARWIATRLGRARPPRGPDAPDAAASHDSRGSARNVQVAGAARTRISRESLSLEPAVLEVHGLTVRYGGVVATDDVSFRLEPGEILGLIGPNGSGKTSLIDAISGFTKVASGRVVLGDVDLTALPPHKRVRAGVCRSFQQLELFESGTVRENLQVASDPRDARAYLTDIVAPGRAELSHLAEVVIQEFELQDVLDRRPSDLPYGTRRLVAIARTIAVGPSVLLLDEPAAGLSDVESTELAHAIRRFANELNLGVLVVEHDMAFVKRICDRIVVLDFGRVIARGTPSEVVSDPVVTEAYLGDDSPVADLVTDVAT